MAPPLRRGDGSFPPLSPRERIRVGASSTGRKRTIKWNRPVRCGQRPSGSYGRILAPSAAFRANARLYLWVAFLGGFTVGVTRIIFNLYIQALGFDAAFLGQLLAVTTAAAGITALPAGLLTDRWGTKRSLVWGSVGVGCGAFGQMVLTTPLLLLVSGALAGAGGAIALAAQAPFLAHYSSRRERTYLFSTMAALFLVSTIVGNLLGGLRPAMAARLAAGALGSVVLPRDAAGRRRRPRLSPCPYCCLLRETYQPPETRRWTLTRRSATALAKLITHRRSHPLGRRVVNPLPERLLRAGAGHLRGLLRHHERRIARPTRGGHAGRPRPWRRGWDRS